MTFVYPRELRALSIAAFLLGSLLLSGAGCELIAGVDRNKIKEDATGTGGGSQGGAGGAGGAGAEGGGGSGGGGGECSTPYDCPGADTDCATRTCEDGICGVEYVPAGTAAGTDTRGDCKKSVCDGQGEITLENDDADVLDDDNECTIDACDAGTPVNTPQQAGTACTQDGGVMCDGAGACVECIANEDCASGVCQANACAAPTCADGVQNGTETDVDCGGMDCGQCPDGDTCSDASDCQSGVCTGNVCQAPTCTDTIENGDETDVDCGGTTCSPCGPGLGCAVNADCIGGSCSGSVCLPTCTDGVVNNMETDVDCGGPNCGGCDDGETCSVGSDCLSLVCNNGVCEAPTCTDTVQNGAETDVDCGGPTCQACADGGSCVVGTDCESGVCTGGVCQAATCADQVQNGAETDVDCGGPTCPPCADGLACLVAGDCESGVCTGGVCQAAACGDGVINGTDACDDGNTVSGDGCSAGCAVEPGYTCNGMPSTCTTTCGDGIVAGTEACDDGGTANGNGCSATCTVESGFTCSGAPSTCTPICGDGLVVGGEGCDDGNTANGDCCSSTCTIEPGCELEPNDACGQVNALPAFAGSPPEATLKGNINPASEFDFYSFTLPGPGVSAVRVETHFGTPGTCPSNTNVDTAIQLRGTDCTTVLASNDDGGGTFGYCSLIDGTVTAAARNLAPGTYFVRVARSTFGTQVPLVGYNVRVRILSTCGNGTVSAPEACDDGNTTAGDGCSSTCAVEAGWGCSGSPSVCTFLCGNGTINPGETCDDGNATSGDGCSSTCAVEAGYSCTGTPSVCSLICSNGVLNGNEACDDGNTTPGDGCSPSCSVESGWVCAGAPSQCSLTPETVCNDGLDNDGDGLVDAADPHCQVPAYFPACGAGETFLVFRSPGPLTLTIPDNNAAGATSTINVTATGTIQRLAVLYNVAHTFDGDLDISLITPTAASLDICSDNGSSGDNFTNTVLDTTCATNVTAGTAPFSGCFKPETTFATFTGTSPTGNWGLKLADDASGDVGSLKNWALLLCTTP